MSGYNWGSFWSLVLEAQSAGEQFDLFDLWDDVASHKEKALLHQEQAEAVKQLIHFLAAKSESLLYAARESPADSLATLADAGGEPLGFWQGRVKRDEPALRPRPTNPDGTPVVATPESIRLKMELARRSVGLARTVQPHPETGLVVIPPL